MKRFLLTTIAVLSVLLSTTVNAQTEMNLGSNGSGTTEFIVKLSDGSFMDAVTQVYPDALELTFFGQADTVYVIVDGLSETVYDAELTEQSPNGDLIFCRQNSDTLVFFQNGGFSNYRAAVFELQYNQTASIDNEMVNLEDTYTVTLTPNGTLNVSNDSFSYDVFQVTVHNMNGQLIYQNDTDSNITEYINVNSGVYIVNIIQDGNRMSKKFYIQ